MVATDGKLSNRDYIKKNIERILLEQSPKSAEIITFIEQIAEDAFDRDRGCGCCADGISFETWLDEEY
jgi:hypothetical protein